MSLERSVRTVQRGFSLIELMVVVVILGLLAGVVIFVVADQGDETRLQVRQSHVQQLFNAVQQYRLRCEQRGIRPVLPDALQDLIDGPADWSGTWSPTVNQIPDNPWGHEYEYVIDDPDAGHFTITCFGRNGREGGEGFDEDYRMSTLPDRR